MTISFRAGKPEDAQACGRICYDAFYAINSAHHFPPDFPNVEIATGLLGMLLGHPRYHVIVAEDNGRVIGSNVVDERGPIAGIGPITVDPTGQNSGVGRQLMQQVLDREERRGAPGVRLVQAAFHNRSLSLYTKLGFDPREPLSCLQGPPLNLAFPGYRVRPASMNDLSDCNEVCRRVHGHTRAGEVSEAMATGALAVVEHDGRITGYSTGVGFIGHSVAATGTDLKALIAAAATFVGPGFLVPTRNADLLRWCLDHGLRITQPLTLMSIGLYNEPQGAYLPSIAY